MTARHDPYSDSRIKTRLSGGFVDPDFGAVTCRGEHSDEHAGGDIRKVAIRNRRHPPTQDTMLWRGVAEDLRAAAAVKRCSSTLVFDVPAFLAISA